MGCLRRLILSVPFTVALAAAVFQLLLIWPLTTGMLPMLVVERNFNASSIPSLDGKVALVTGCNSGLGLETATALAKNGAKVFMSCRTLAKCEGAAKTVRESAPDASLKLIVADLGDLASVRAAANQVRAETDKLDILVLNAATGLGEFYKSKQDWELQFAVNHVAHFYLTAKLTPLLRRPKVATVTAVSSNALTHFPGFSHPYNAIQLPYPHAVPVTNEQLNYEDGHDYHPGHAYSRSKLANLLFAQEFAAREAKHGTLCNTVHPGGVNTAVLKEVRLSVEKNASPFVLRLYDIVMDFANEYVLFSAEDAVLTQLYTAVSPEIVDNKVTGKLFFPIGQEMAPESLIAAAVNVTLQKDLWTFTEELLKSQGFIDY